MILDISKYTSLSFNSKDVTVGGIFIAIRGEKFNGEDYIEEAIERGAAAIVYDKQSNIALSHSVEYIPHNNPRKALSEIASQIYPNQPKNIVGVTGTCGKTSVVGFFRQICDLHGLKSASLGTLGVVANDLEFESLGSMTTPDSIQLHSVLDELSKENFTHIGIEVSSHGLHQHRLDNVKFKAGCFTNFSQDHLDYHNNMDEYLTAKIRFFREVLEPKSYVILNKDMSQFKAIYDISKSRNMDIITIGKSEADITFTKKNELHINAFGKHYTTEFPIFAEFQQYNVVCALALCLTSGIDLDHSVPYIPHMKSAIGRLEKIADYQGASIYVDNAHKPDALEKVLTTAREFTDHKLHVLFGCGGDRDKSKRPIMGRIASQLADNIIITDDNPRMEDAASIRKQILVECPSSIEISNRRDAIRFAIKQLREGDTLIIAGKGHEEYQIIGNIKYRFNDTEEVIKIVNEVSDE